MKPVTAFRGACMLLLLAVPLSILHADWTQTTGPDGGMVVKLKVNEGNGHVFAGTNGGVFRSDNAGVSWQWVSNGLPANLQVTALYSSGSNTYVYGTSTLSTGALYWSSNEGAAWSTMTGTGLPTLPVIECFLTSGSNLLAGVYGLLGNSGVYRSTDNGATWTVFSTGLPANFIPAEFGVAEANIFTGGSISSSTKGAYISTNGGANWSAVNTNFSTTAGVTGFATVGSTLFAATLNGGIYKTTNNGSSWTNVTPPLALGAFSIAGSATNVFLGAGVIFRSDATVSAWDTVNAGLPARNAGTDIKALAVSGSSVVASFAKLGIWRSTNNGASWSKSSSGLRALDMWGLYADGSTLFASGTATGFFRSLNNGDTWAEANSNVNLLNNGYYGFAVSGSYLIGGSGVGPYRSSDQGGSWLTPSPDLPSVAYSFVVDGNDVYASGQGYVARSSNNGANWTTLTTGFLFQQAVFALFKSGPVMLAGASSGGVKRSTDNGATWTAPVSGLATSGAYYSFAQVNSTFFTAYAGGVYRSTDNGASWTAANSGVTGAPQALHARVGDLFVGTNQGIYRSTNLGTSWTPINTGLPLTPAVSVITSNSQYLFAGLNPNSVWRRPLAEVTGVAEIWSGNAQSFALEQNYPNPFNPGTNIRFNVHGSGFVSISVYDVLGNEVAKLVNENLNSGTYETRFNALGLASGVYFYKLSVGGFTATKRMLLMK